LKKLAKKQRYKVYEDFHIKQKNFTAAEKFMKRSKTFCYRL